MTKICSKCGISKDETAYYASLTGRDAACKDCRNKRHYEQRIAKRIAAGKRVIISRIKARELAEQGLRYCPKCKRVLSHSDFSANRRSKYNTAWHCKQCCQLMHAERTADPADKRRRREAYLRRKVYMRDRLLQQEYGMTSADYAALLASQNGMCATCGRSAEDNGKALAVDHDHTTGKIRGLLCSYCNIAIGYINDNANTASQIHYYLLKHKEV